MQSLSSHSLCSEVMHYRSLMDKLIYEKEGSQSCQIEQKIEKSKELSKNLFSIEGDEKFTQLFNEQIVELCQLKPGRKLIKYLSKSSDIKIVVKNGSTSEQGGGVITIDPQLDGKYNARVADSYVLSKKPLKVTIAHELIHELHQRCNWLLYMSNSHSDINGIFRNRVMGEMDDIEEQQTILGLTYRNFFDAYTVKFNPAKKIDVICENAFLLALNLPPRVDHRGGESRLSPLDEKWSENQKENNFDFYYQWLDEILVLTKYKTKKAASAVKDIIYDDVETALKCLEHKEKFPNFSPQISDSLLDGEELFLKARNRIHNFFNTTHAWFASSNMNVMMKLGQTNFDDFFEAAPILWADKEFVLHVLSCCKDQNSVKLTLETVNSKRSSVYKAEISPLSKEKEFILCALSYCKDQDNVKLILENIDSSLKDDPEILSCASNIID